MKMKTSEFMDKRIEELSRSHSDDLSEISYSHLREDGDDDDDDHFFGLNMLTSNSSFCFEPIRPVVSEPSRSSAFWVCFCFDGSLAYVAISFFFGCFSIKFCSSWVYYI